MRNDHAAALTGWLQQQLGDDAAIIHQGSGNPIGDNDVAEVFTIVLPAAQMEQLFRLTSLRGTVAGDGDDIRIQSVKAIYTMVCSRGKARRSFIVLARTLQW